MSNIDRQAALLLDLAVPNTFTQDGSWEQVMDAVERLFKAEPGNAVQVGPGGAILLGSFLNAHVGVGMTEVFATLRREYPIASHEQAFAVARLRSLREVLETHDAEGYLTVSVRDLLALLDSGGRHVGE